MAFLALRSPSVVPVSELVDALWGESPPRSAVKTLRTYVSSLRRSGMRTDPVTDTGVSHLVDILDHLQQHLPPERVDQLFTSSADISAGEAVALAISIANRALVEQPAS